MSRKYGVKVYNFANPEYPYFVDGLSDDPFDRDCGCTEQEIQEFVDYHHQNEKLSPWACEIIGWYESMKFEPDRWDDEVEDVVEEVNFYLDTMYGEKEMKEYPKWLQYYLYELEETLPPFQSEWLINILDKVMPHLT